MANENRDQNKEKGWSWDGEGGELPNQLSGRKWK